MAFVPQTDFCNDVSPQQANNYDAVDHQEQLRIESILTTTNVDIQSSESEADIELLSIRLHSDINTNMQ